MVSLLGETWDTFLMLNKEKYPLAFSLKSQSVNAHSSEELVIFHLVKSLSRGQSPCPQYPSRFWFRLALGADVLSCFSCEQIFFPSYFNIYIYAFFSLHCITTVIQKTLYFGLFILSLGYVTELIRSNSFSNASPGFSRDTVTPPAIMKTEGFPGGAVVEILPAGAGDTGSSPGLGGSHMPRSNWAREPQLLSLRVWSLCSATGEAAIVKGPRTAMKSGPRSPQLEKALAQKWRPNTAKNK